MPSRRPRPRALAAVLFALGACDQRPLYPLLDARVDARVRDGSAPLDASLPALDAALEAAPSDAAGSRDP